MEINFESQKTARDCAEEERRRRRWGPAAAKKIALRLQQLQAAESLADMRQLPGQCHEQSGRLARTLTIDVLGSLRLVFRPAETPSSSEPDDGFDWTKIDRITILEVADDH